MLCTQNLSADQRLLLDYELEIVPHIAAPLGQLAFECRLPAIAGIINALTSATSPGWDGSGSTVGRPTCLAQQRAVFPSKQALACDATGNHAVGDTNLRCPTTANCARPDGRHCRQATGRTGLQFSRDVTGCARQPACRATLEMGKFGVPHVEKGGAAAT